MLQKQPNICFFPIFTLFLYFLLYSSLVKAQQASESQIKAGYVYNFLKTVDWPNDVSRDKYRIEIFGNEPEFIEWLLKIQSLKVKNKSIQVTVCKTFESITSPNLLVICKSENELAKDIFDRLKGKSTLMVTDACVYQQYTMINFVTNKNNKVQFQINTRNLEETEIQNTSKLVLLGGTEIDVRQLYQQTEQSLILEKEISSLYQKELEQKKQEIIEAKAKLAELNEQLSEKQAKIEKQKEELLGLGSKLEVQKLKLDEKNKILIEQQSKILQKEILLKEKQSKLLDLQSQAVEYAKVLKGQKTEIEKRQFVLDKQDKTLSSQLKVIRTQKTFLYILTTLIVLIVALAVLALHNFWVIRKKKQHLELLNVKLNIKNEQLNSSRQEIFEQKEELEITKNNK